MARVSDSLPFKDFYGSVNRSEEQSLQKNDDVLVSYSK